MRSIFGYLGSSQINIEHSSYSNDEDFHVFCKSNQKFEKDKIFTNTKDNITVLDGVILNKVELLNKSECTNWESYIMSKWKSSPNDFLNTLRGEFSGVVYNKTNRTIQLFNNPTGTRQLFYYHQGSKFAFASSAIDLITLVKKLKWEIEVDKQACYSFLAYNALINGTSWLVNSKKLRPGSLLQINDKEAEVIHYKTFFITEDTSKSKKELLDTFDKLITNAVKLEWEKDKEYEYQSFSTLSGGLDSRVNVMLARKLGYIEQVNFCCSQKGYADESISRQMAKDFKHTYYFHALDGLEHFYEAEYMNVKIGGGSAYMGPAHLRYGVDQYWDESYGIVHSGQLGDGLLGGFLSQNTMIAPNLNFGRESYDLLPKDEAFEDELLSKYSDEETFKMYERGFQIANSGFWILEDLSYYTSPFMDIDLLDFLAKLPYQYKYKRTFYLEWMNAYHPEMTEYEWEYIHSKPNAVWKTKYATTFMRLKYGWRKLISPEFRLKFDMSPEQYWYNNSEKLQLYYRTTIDNKLEVLRGNDFPYKNEVITFGKSNNVNHLSKALSILLIMEEIFKKNA